MKRVMKSAGGVLAAALLMTGLGTANAQLRQGLETGERATKKAEDLQRQINQLDDQRSDMIGEYRTLLQRTTAEQLFVRQQEKVVEAQRAEIASLTEQLTRVDDIAAQTTPMLYDMIEDLKTFVAADLPFKMDERNDRLASLEAVMERPDVSQAERYRLIVEAYQAELEYGNTVDSWEEEVDVNGAPTNVEFFQYGRVALVYATPDRKVIRRFNRETRTWDDLSGKYREDIAKAIRIARGVAQPDVLFGPVSKFSVGQ